jgi:hypothetical protein
MDPHTAELVTVVSHSEDGRILQYIKNLIPVTEADQMKAAARLRAEEKKAAALVRDTDALVEKAAHLPPPEQKPTAPAVARPEPQQRAVPRAPAARAPAEGAAADAIVPARVAAAAKRKQQEKPSLEARLRKLPDAERKAFLAKATKILAKHTIDDGKEVGRTAMKVLIDRTPPGHTASNVDKSLESFLRFGLKRLQDNAKYPLAKWPEFPAFFERGFWLGANEAVAEYNSKHKQSAPCQPEQ